MTANPVTGASAPASGGITNAEILSNAPVVDDLSAWALPEFFESDDELAEFQRWVREQRDADVA